MPVSSLVDAYLTRLGCAPLAGAAPSVSALGRLHRAHVEHVPYETVDLVAGRPPGIEPRESAERVVSGRGGYCYQLNEAFSWLLRELGYDVVRHVAGVDILRGRVLTRWDASGTAARELDADEWWDALTGRFELVLAKADREPLWRKVGAAHEAWRAARRQKLRHEAHGLT